MSPCWLWTNLRLSCVLHSNSSRGQQRVIVHYSKTQPHTVKINVLVNEQMYPLVSISATRRVRSANSAPATSLDNVRMLVHSANHCRLNFWQKTLSVVVKITAFSRPHGQKEKVSHVSLETSPQCCQCWVHTFPVPLLCSKRRSRARSSILAAPQTLINNRTPKKTNTRHKCYKMSTSVVQCSARRTQNWTWISSICWQVKSPRTSLLLCPSARDSTLDGS